MKILRLDLIAYGPFTGKTLDLQDGANLHIIYGPNEAGKSSALRALSNALYGIPQTRKDDFLHRDDELRIGLALDLKHGAIQVVRRKGRASSLRRADGTDAVIPPEEWLPMLPVQNRETFDRMFGVDHAEIAKGGELLLSSGSDLGRLLFEMAGGVAGLRRVQTELQKSADAMYRKVGAKLPLNKAAAELKAALKAAKESLLLVSEYKQLRRSLEEAEAQSHGLEMAIRAASLAEQRLLRLGQAVPLVAKRQQRVEQLKQYEDGWTLAADFAARYRDAHDELRRAEAEEQSQERDIEGLKAKIDATPLTPGILERDSEIDLLYEQSGGVKDGVKHCTGLRLKLEDAGMAARALLDSIGVQMPLEQAAELRVPDAVQKRITTLAMRQQVVDLEVASSARELEKAREELSALGEATDTEAMEAALAKAPPGRDLEEDLSRLLDEVRAGESELERGVSALPDWNGSLEELASAAAPLAETVTTFQNSFLVQAAEEKRLLVDRSKLKAEQDRVERDLRKLAREQAVPTEQDLVSSRTGRDSEWRTIRRAWLETMEVNGPELATSFEGAVVASDELADRLRREAARVSKKADLLVNQERLEEQSAEIEAELEALLGVTTALRRDWESRWSAAGVLPRLPLEMQSWLQKRDAILAERRALKLRQVEADGLRGTITAIRQALISERAVDVATPLSQLIAQARRAVARQADAERLTREIPELEERMRSAGNALSLWSFEWREATGKLPVRQGASPEEVQVAVDLVKSLIVKLKDMEGFADRIQKLTTQEAEFSVKVRSLVESPGLEVAAESPFARIARLNAELQQNRTNRDLLKSFVKQSDEKQRQLQHSRGQAAQYTGLLVELCNEAGAADARDLPEYIERAAEKRRIIGELSDVEDNLAGFAGGGTIEQLVLEVQGLNADELPNRLEEAHVRVEALRAEKTVCDQSLGASRLALNQKEDADSAVGAAEDVEHLRSRIAGLADEYVRLRLASQILANAVERFRERNQGPLLKTAAQIFRQLTDGSFEDLGIDWNDQGEAELVGIRGGNQKRVGVEGMSEATRDQLFLALRLAYVRNHCGEEEPVPFIADDVLMTFDDARATAALKALETLSKNTQVLLFTHHQHHLELARAGLTQTAYRVHNLGE